MYRQLEEHLKKWKNDPFRLPLLFRGARQVGKSYLAETFGREHFESFVSVNFEANPEYCACFETLDPQEIISKMELISGQLIVPGKTLLFLDEIQNCPRAITAIRYFKEKMPLLHVIGAGSLLEFAFQKGEYSFPVGRVEPVYVRPLSFQEYLIANNALQLPKALEQASLASPLSKAIHEHFSKLVRQYFLIGGMPAPISIFLKTQSFLKAQEMQAIILEVYQSDFSKYAKERDHKFLRVLFEKIPLFIGQHFKPAKLDPEAKTADLRKAFASLAKAGIVLPVYATSGAGIPLKAHQKENSLKALFLDIGLIQQVHQVDKEKIWTEDLTLLNAGALAEQFVGQELLALGEIYQTKDLFFWEREKQGSEAEVDYLITVGSNIIPIEVKAGKTGKMRSLKLFLEEKKAPLGVRISQSPLSLENKILSIPFYMVSHIDRLVQEALASFGES